MCRIGELGIAVEGDDRVAVPLLPQALRGRGRQRGASVAAPFREVATRQEADGAQQRDRDRLSVVEDRVLAEPIYAQGKTARRAADGDEVVKARVRGRGLDPPGADLERSEEHTSELQSRGHLVCRLLLE